MLQSLQASAAGLTLGELLAQHPQLPRRTAQRWLGDLVAAGQVQAQGEGRARRCVAGSGAPVGAAVDRFPSFIPLSADSRDVLAYVQQPLAARKPVGYQREFLESYEPNRSYCLPEPLRRQLHRLGRTSEAQAPAGTYSRAILGVDEMTRVELLRDLYVWAYERSTQEYPAIRQDLAQPDPLRLAWRDLLKQVVRDVVRHPGEDPLPRIRQAVASGVPEAERDPVQALVIEELRRLHEGVLARYGLTPSDFMVWQKRY